MSSELAIQVNHLSKCFYLYNEPRDRLLQMFARRRKKHAQEFWALKDVSFQVNQGESVGIIGVNGSGKSTLLQMICGTHTPTEGNVITQGRMAALLELGSGFNPEFTGYENVYMNASILGLKKEEIDARYQDIIAFADIGDFIDQPVKTYSSGMMVRLAFAVIAHVDADILIIDEALAVGDAIFTSKCMQFIRGFKKKGTLVFVSHDMSSVINLCDKAIWLEKGEIIEQGGATEISEAYLQFTLQNLYGQETSLKATNENKKSRHDDKQNEAPSFDKISMVDYGSQLEFTQNIEHAHGFQTGIAEIKTIKIENLSYPEQTIFKGWEWVCVTLHAVAHEALLKPILGFTLNDRLGQTLFGENTLPFTDKNPLEIKKGSFFSARFKFRLPMLPNGDYVMFASVANGTLYDNIQHHLLHNALVITVSSSTVRWGLVGIPFDEVFMAPLDE